MAMHDDEMHIDEQVARRLITDQFPEWRLECVRRMTTNGTVNAIFRIGADLTARFPLRSADPTDMRAELAREAAAMRELSASCPVATPAPVAMGDPGHGYQHSTAIWPRVCAPDVHSGSPAGRPASERTGSPG